jgi:hypothetical protein
VRVTLAPPDRGGQREMGASFWSVPTWRRLLTWTASAIAQGWFSDLDVYPDAAPRAGDPCVEAPARCCPIGRGKLALHTKTLHNPPPSESPVAQMRTGSMENVVSR